MRKSRWTVLVLVALAALAASPVAASAAPPSPDTGTEIFVCPSTSTHNAAGNWVIGAHGAYYVLVPTRGPDGTGGRVFTPIPERVAGLAQIPAGWALYKDVFPEAFEADGSSSLVSGFFTGTVGDEMGQTNKPAVLLGEGIENWLGSPDGWNEFDMATVVDNGDGTYTVYNMTVDESITIDLPIPVASAVFW